MTASRIVPDFWEHATRTICSHLCALGVPAVEAVAVIAPLISRLSTIPPDIPYDADNCFWTGYAALLVDGCTASQRLFAAQHGYVPGEIVGSWPPTPIAFEEPFLRAMQAAVNALEAAANKASGRKGLH